MFEDEDVILPEDYQEAQPQADDIDLPIDESENTNEEETVEELKEQSTSEVAEEPLRFKVKYNHEEQELGYDEAVPLIQKGMNYDKLQEKLTQFESDPRLALIEELASENNMTTEEYISAVKEHKEQEKLNQLIQQNIPEELAREILETRKLREEINSEKQTKVEEEKKNADFTDFFQYYKEANGKEYDHNNDPIPQEVWQANQNGVPLKYAYMEHQLSQLQSQMKTIKQNEENAKRAPIGGLTQHGSNSPEAEDDFMRGFNSI